LAESFKLKFCIYIQWKLSWISKWVEIFFTICFSLNNKIKFIFCAQVKQRQRKENLKKTLGAHMSFCKYFYFLLQLLTSLPIDCKTKTIFFFHSLWFVLLTWTVHVSRFLSLFLFWNINSFVFYYWTRFRWNWNLDSEENWKTKLNRKWNDLLHFMEKF
jgi:hypothetical protein